MCGRLPSIPHNTLNNSLHFAQIPYNFIIIRRVLGLLRGLTASLDVSQSYLEVMTPYARMALRDQYIEKQNKIDLEQKVHIESKSNSILKVRRKY